MSQQQNIIDFRLGGGINNASKTQSFGGYCSQNSNAVIQSNTPNNLFGHVNRSTMISGTMEYLCVYAHVLSSTEGLPSAKFWLDRGTISDENSIFWSLEPVTTPSDFYRYSPYKTYDGATRDTTADTASLDLVQFSCSAWFRTSTNYSTTGTIVIKENFTLHNYGLWIDANEKMNGGFHHSVGDRIVTSPLSYNDDKWHHVVVTYDQVNLKLYIDGNTTPVATTPATETPVTGTNNLATGGNSSVADRFWTGDLDEIYVWNNDLTSSEIASLYNAGVTPQVSAIVFEQHFGVTQQNYKYFPYKNFNGTSDFTEQAHSSSLNLVQFSLSCWFLTQDNFTNLKPLVGKGVDASEAAGDNWNYVLYLDSSERLVGGFEESAGTDHLVTSSASYNDNIWHHAVVTYDQVNVKIYIDGVFLSSVAANQTPNTNTRNLRIGCDSTGTAATFYSGYIDEVYVWNDDLTASEIREMYWNGVIPQQTDIVYEQHYGDDNGSIVAQTINDINREPSGMSWKGADEMPDDPNFYIRDLRKTENGSNFTSTFPIWFRRKIEANSNDSVDNKATFKLAGQLRRTNTPQGGDDDDSGGSDTPNDVEPIMFGAVGDTDCKTMTDTIFKKMDDNDVMMPLLCGDLNYKSDRGCIADKINKYWKIGGSGDDMAMAVIGNHDDESGKMKEWISDFKMQSHGAWYHIHENVAIIGMNSETSFSTSSSQYDFVLKSLKAADSDSNVDWIIVMIHRPFISSDSNHSPNEGGKTDIYMPLFTQYHVDIVLQAHNHNFQRSKLVKDNTSDHENPKTVESTSPFTKGRGMLVFTVGTGGHDTGGDLYDITGSTPSWQQVEIDDENGFLKIDFMGTNNNQCELTFINDSGEELDQVMIQ